MMIPYSGTGGSPTNMPPHAVGSPDEVPAGSYGISPSANLTQSTASGANKQYPVSYSASPIPQNMEALDLSMSPPYMQRMSGLNAPGLVESPKPFAQPPSTDGKRRRTSPAMQPMMSPVQPGPQGNEPDLAHMGQPVR